MSEIIARTDLLVLALLGLLVLATAYLHLRNIEGDRDANEAEAANQRVLAELADIQINRPHYIIRDTNEEYEHEQET